MSTEMPLKREVEEMNKYLKRMHTRTAEHAASLRQAVDVLAPLVAREGSEMDILALEEIAKVDFAMIRSVIHMDYCVSKRIRAFAIKFDMAGLCREIGRELEGPAMDQQVEFDYDADPDSLLILGDDYQLRVAIYDMLTNAFQAVGEGGHVSLNCKRVGDQCRITVRDDGPGVLPPLEEEDYTPDQPWTERYYSMKMGVPVIRRLAEAHDGTFSLFHEEGGDTYAVLSVPVNGPKEHVGELRPRIVRAAEDALMFCICEPILGHHNYHPDALM